MPGIYSTWKDNWFNLIFTNIFARLFLDFLFCSLCVLCVSGNSLGIIFHINLFNLLNSLTTITCFFFFLSFLFHLFSCMFKIEAYLLPILSIVLCFLIHSIC